MAINMTNDIKWTNKIVQRMSNLVEFNSFELSSWNI